MNPAVDIAIHNALSNSHGGGDISAWWLVLFFYVLIMIPVCFISTVKRIEPEEGEKRPLDAAWLLGWLIWPAQLIVWIREYNASLKKKG